MSRHPEIPMTPDGTEVWSVIDWPGIGGFALSAPGCSNDDLAILYRAAAGIADYPQMSVGGYIDGGGSGNVFRWGTSNRALKVMHKRLSATEFPHLQANITLRAGLQRWPSPPEAKVTYTAPDYLAAYFPYPEHGRGSSIWLMSYEPGSKRHNLAPDFRKMIPHPSRRAHVYHQALRASGGNPADYRLDMDKIFNELFRPGLVPADTPQAVGDLALTIVKFDIGRMLHPDPIAEFLLPPNTWLYDDYDTPRYSHGATDRQ